MSTPLATPILAPSPGRGLGCYFVLFTVSGGAGLIYESIWSHYLKRLLGHATYAQTLVLMLFMGGMTIGSWVAGKRSHRWRNLLGAYAVAEAVIGVFALLFHSVFVAAVAAFHAAVHGSARGPQAVDLLK